MLSDSNDAQAQRDRSWSHSAPSVMEMRTRPTPHGGAPPDGRPPWPDRPAAFSDLLTPVEAAQYLRLDETGSHTPTSAIRTLNYWRDRGELKATKFARHVWYRKRELDRFLEVKTES